MNKYKTNKMEGVDKMVKLDPCFFMCSVLVLTLKTGSHKTVKHLHNKTSIVNILIYTPFDYIYCKYTQLYFLVK